MNKIFKTFAMIMAFAVTGLFASCNSCSKPSPEPEPVAELNVQELMINDYDSLASQYPHITFYEAEIHLDKKLSDSTAAVDSLINVFQVEDTCIKVIHSLNQEARVAKIHGHWSECISISPRVPVGFDSVMTIIADKRPELHTQFITFRSPLAPPFSMYGYWIFGRGIYWISSETGEPVEFETCGLNLD